MKRFSKLRELLRDVCIQIEYAIRQRVTAELRFWNRVKAQFKEWRPFR